MLEKCSRQIDALCVLTRYPGPVSVATINVDKLSSYRLVYTPFTLLSLKPSKSLNIRRVSVLQNPMMNILRPLVHRYMWLLAISVSNMLSASDGCITYSL